MATRIRQHIARVAQGAVKTGAKTLPGLFRKYKNDWVMNFAAALAFHLITAMLPTLIALLAVAGLAVSKLSSSATVKLLDILKALFPASQDFVTAALNSLSKNAGPPGDHRRAGGHLRRVAALCQHRLGLRPPISIRLPEGG